MPADHLQQRPERSSTASPLVPLARDVLAVSAEDAARALLGVLVVREDDAGRRVGRIVEVEAYGGPRDRASHARAGRTRRTGVMFGPPGHAYVYLVYGMHHCLNVVCGPDGEASAVLLRAIAPVDGIPRMRAARRASGGPAGEEDTRLAAGPARLCQALGIDRALDGRDLLVLGDLWLAQPAHDRPWLKAGEHIVSGPRIGVAYAGPEWAERPWRLGIAGHPALSRPFPAGA
jgi:DNA-3-methyladenine glycosylase